jgi:hypothetical protein
MGVPMLRANRKPPGGGSADTEIAVGVSVLVYPGTDRQRLGVVVEDFGDSAGQPVQIGVHHIVDAARRWAVQLVDGTLVFVDSSDLATS